MNNKSYRKIRECKYSEENKILEIIFHDLGFIKIDWNKNKIYYRKGGLEFLIRLLEYFLITKNPNIEFAYNFNYPWLGNMEKYPKENISIKKLYEIMKYVILAQ